MHLLPAELLAEQLHAAIRAGQLAPGARLPTDIELRKKYGLSSHTVGRAIDRLRRQGVVETRGGAGRFVIDPPRPQSRLQYPTADTDPTALAPAASSLSASSATHLVAQLLAIDKGAPVEVRRWVERTGKRPPVIHSVTAPRAPDAAPAAPARASDLVGARLALPEESGDLQVEAATLVIVRTRITYDTVGHALSVHDLIAAADRNELVYELTL